MTAAASRRPICWLTDRWYCLFSEGLGDPIAGMSWMLCKASTPTSQALAPRWSWSRPSCRPVRQTWPTSKILWDETSKVAEAFKLAFTLPDDLREVYRGFGNDLAVRNGDPSWRLPVPARFVIDREGIVRSVEADPDYRYRPEPETTLAALRKLAPAWDGGTRRTRPWSTTRSAFAASIASMFLAPTAAGGGSSTIFSTPHWSVWPTCLLSCGRRTSQYRFGEKAIAIYAGRTGRSYGIATAETERHSDGALRLAEWRIEPGFARDPAAVEGRTVHYVVLS
jgi:hypothetical protein